VFAALAAFPAQPTVQIAFKGALSSLPSEANFPVTFITIPKPQLLHDQIDMAKLVLTIWLSYPGSHVVIFSTAAEYDPLNMIIPYITARFGTGRFTFVEGLPTGYEGRPLVREWFRAGTSRVKSGFLCFTNGDMIVPPEWMSAARRVFDSFDKAELARTLIFGTRTDVRRSSQLFEIDPNSPFFLQDLSRYLDAHIKGDNPYGMDLVMIHSSFAALRWEDMPDFVIGMCVWDNFFMGWATSACTTVTMDFQVRLFHVDHGPNACNDQNYEYFRDMARRSPQFYGFQEHHEARLRLQLRERRLVGMYDRTVSLRP
jgi:hypothetical protein